MPRIHKINKKRDIILGLLNINTINHKKNSSRVKFWMFIFFTAITSISLATYSTYTYQAIISLELSANYIQDNYSHFKSIEKIIEEINPEKIQIDDLDEIKNQANQETYFASYDFLPEDGHISEFAKLTNEYIRSTTENISNINDPLKDQINELQSEIDTYLEDYQKHLILNDNVNRLNTQTINSIALSGILESNTTEELSESLSKFEDQKAEINITKESLNQLYFEDENLQQIKSSSIEFSSDYIEKFYRITIHLDKLVEESKTKDYDQIETRFIKIEEELKLVNQMDLTPSLDQMKLYTELSNQELQINYIQIKEKASKIEYIYQNLLARDNE